MVKCGNSGRFIGPTSLLVLLSGLVSACHPYQANKLTYASDSEKSGSQDVGSGNKSSIEGAAQTDSLATLSQASTKTLVSKPTTPVLVLPTPQQIAAADLLAYKSRCTANPLSQFSWLTITQPDSVRCFDNVESVLATLPTWVSSMFVLIDVTRSAQTATFLTRSS